MNLRIQKRFLACALVLFACLAGYSQEPEGEQAQSGGVLNWQGVTLDNALVALEKLTNKVVIRPEQLPTPKLTIRSDAPLSVEEQIVAIESLLSLNGIGVTPMGDKFLKVVPVGNVRTETPELIIGSLGDRYPSGKVVSKLFRLEYLDSQAFQSQIQPFMSPNFSVAIPFQNSNAVIVTDTVANLQRLEYLVTELDKPIRLNIETRFYALQYADATEVASQMQELIDNARSRFGEANSSSSQSQGRQSQEGPIQRASNAASGEGAIPVQILFGATTAIAADDRTNNLIIMTEPSNMKFFEDIIEKLDVKADAATRIEVIPLKHADAEEVASLLSNLVSGRNQDSSDRLQANANQSLDESTERPGPFNNVREQQRQNAERQSVAVSAVNSSLEERDSQFSDFMTIIADTRSNSLVISGTRSDLELMREIVGQIDVLLPQVLIEVVILDVTLGKEHVRGVDSLAATYTQATDRYQLAPGSAGAFNILGLDLAGTEFTLKNGEFTDVFLNAVLRRARTDETVKVLSVPNVVTSHNKEASFISGQSVPILTSTQSGSTVDSFTRDSFQQQDIVIELTVTPLIGNNDIIQLEITQTINEIAGEVFINDNSQPIIGRREVKNFVSVEDGQLLILGGLQRERSAKTRNKPAIIGDIPIIGNIFAGKSKSRDRSELMVFVRPRIMRTTDDIDVQSDDLLGKLSEGEIVENFVNTGKVSVPNGEDANNVDEEK